MKENITLTAEQQALVEEHMQVVHWTIHHYIDINESVCGMGYDDLYQEGCEALCRAAASYDAQAGAQFATYAGTVIRNHLLDSCRSLQAKCRKAPVVSLDECGEGGAPRDYLLSYDDTDRKMDRLCLAQLLEHGRRNYTGTALLGIEAMELKVKGYTGTDIARLYGVKPTLVGAWISRAVEKLRKDVALASDEGGVLFYLIVTVLSILLFGARRFKEMPISSPL